MTMATYSIGKPLKPRIIHDNGFLDKFARRAPTISDRLNYAKWYAKLEAAEAIQNLPLLPHTDIPDGLAAYRHFMKGSGKKRWFSYERYVSNDSSGKMTLKNIVSDVSQGAIFLFKTTLQGQRLPLNYKITSSALTANENNPFFPYPATENWQKAIGGHNFWVSADVHVEKNSVGQFQFSLDMTLHVEDMYNFNPDAQDIATGIPDSDNGVFSITGLAQQYLNYSTLRRTIKWDGLGTNVLIKVSKQPSSRTRQPSDNRRIRNNL